MPMNSIAVVRSRSKSLSLGCTLMAAAAFFVLFTEGAAPATQIGAPAMDHHQHLFSPTLADLVNGTPAPGTTVSAELRNLLEQRAANWHSPGALKGLLASDAEAFTRGAFGWVHGRDAVADHLDLEPVFESVDAAFDSCHVAAPYTKYGIVGARRFRSPGKTD